MTGFAWMFEFLVATFAAHQIPSIGKQPLDEI
ncbi:hypothetical protein SIID45300_03046 [Candidatus Magnetaquicoccaceae bacterium FCR-1]|uniref:Uncharacterized protein n=1 Tax=Candidatus Magnetaquiglobus chichijimensis TaxID=3141448 RepID=A0ABQ0CCR6_9PROT